jgi:hypothetical protein
VRGFSIVSCSLQRTYAADAFEIFALFAESFHHLHRSCTHNVHFFFEYCFLFISFAHLFQMNAGNVFDAICFVVRMFTKCSEGPMGSGGAGSEQRPYVFDEKDLFR